MELTIEDLKRIFANPVYCLAEVQGWKIKDGKTMVTEEQWIRVAIKQIEEYGAEAFLKNLLENLKGNYVEGGEK